MLNRATIIGHLGQDPKMSVTANGSKCARFSVATSKKYRQKDSDEMVEKVTWHNCSAFGKTAELVDKFIAKGSKVYVEGEIDNNVAKKEGEPDKFFSSIIVSRIIFLDSKSERKEREDGADERPQKPSDDFGGFQDDDIPF